MTFNLTLQEHVPVIIGAAGKHGDLVAHKSERTGKRFIRCTNYDECGTSYPLPQRGELHATGETCPDCGAPMVEVTTARGPTFPSSGLAFARRSRLASSMQVI